MTKDFFLRPSQSIVSQKGPFMSLASGGGDHLNISYAFLKEGMGWNFVPATLGQTINDEIIDLVRKEKISPVVGKVVDFADVPSAIEDMGNRLTVGRSIVKLF